MNAERLHAITKALKAEFDAKTLVALLRNLVKSLRLVVQQPSANSQENLASSRDAFFEGLADSPSDHFSPTWREVLNEIGGEEFFGIKLRTTVEAILANNQMTPTVAADELDDIRERMVGFETAVTELNSAFEHMGISDETLDPGQCEIGVLIPRGEVDNNVLGFAKELDELAFILNHFSEVATGSPDPLAIKSISSSDFLVYLNAGVTFAAFVAVAVERVVALYKNLLEIRKLQLDIRNQGVPDAATKSIEDYANQLMKTGIEKLSIEMVNEYYKEKDSGRKNELVNGMRISLNMLANRIDHGYNLEVRCEPLSDNASDQSEDMRKSIAKVLAASSNMQFLKLDGKPLLRLPEQNNQELAETDTSSPVEPETRRFRRKRAKSE
jgi:hypothetical protein